jgi:hypothetical protein
VTSDLGNLWELSFDALAAFNRSRERAKRARASVRLPVAACERPIARHLGGVSNLLIDQKTIGFTSALESSSAFQ